jgi:predicted nucleic acid-binding protein
MEHGGIIADTGIWIEYFRGKGPVSEALLGLIQGGAIRITGPVVYELLQGAKNKKDADLIKEITQALPRLAVTHETWLLAGDLFFDLRIKGVTLPPSDVLLSALAIENNCSLFTLDHHFNHIPKVRRYPYPGKKS